MRPEAKLATLAGSAAFFPLLWAYSGLGPHTADHLPEAAVAAVVWWLLEWLSAWASPRLFPASYGALDATSRKGWNSRFPSTVHALLVCTVAPYLLLGRPGATLGAASLVYGYNVSFARLLSWSSGYFVWDTYVSVMQSDTAGVAFVAHGVLCLFVYTNALRPFALYYATIFLCFEASTPSLNAWWYLQKTGHGGSLAQRACGVATLAAFLFVRIMYGTYHSVGLWRAMLAEWGACAKSEAGCGLYFTLSATVTLAINVALSLLNFVWFYRGAASSFCRRRHKDKLDVDVVSPIGSPVHSPANSPTARSALLAERHSRTKSF